MNFKSWRDLPEGGIIKNVPTSPNFKTGDWKSKQPKFIKEKCTNCLLCWLYCPDSVIEVKDGKVCKFHLDFCKGCGICSEVCPASAIEMEDIR